MEKRGFKKVFYRMKLLGGMVIVASCLGVAGCSVEKVGAEKVRDVEFTVVDPEDVPEEFAGEIEGAKEEEMKLSYGDDGYLYVARGYGCRETTGYSVEVEKCYETKDSVRVKTRLLGPGKEEKILDRETYPYVVIKMEYMDKPVVYD